MCYFLLFVFDIFKGKYFIIDKSEHLYYIHIIILYTVKDLHYIHRKKRIISYT